MSDHIEEVAAMVHLSEVNGILNPFKVFNDGKIQRGEVCCLRQTPIFDANCLSLPLGIIKFGKFPIEVPDEPNCSVAICTEEGAVHLRNEMLKECSLLTGEYASEFQIPKKASLLSLAVVLFFSFVLWCLKRLLGTVLFIVNPFFAWKTIKTGYFLCKSLFQYWGIGTKEAVFVLSFIEIAENFAGPVLLYYIGFAEWSIPAAVFTHTEPVTLPLYCFLRWLIVFLWKLFWQ